MFIKLGERRINMSIVKEYRAINKNTISGDYFSIGLIFLNDTTEELHFFKDQEKRDNLLLQLDKNFLKDLS